MGIRRCILHDSFDDHASFWILSAISVIAQNSMGQLKSP
jgi:hypothetical protein